jgi:hypothetical protein
VPAPVIRVENCPVVGFFWLFGPGLLNPLQILAPTTVQDPVRELHVIDPKFPLR